MYLRLYLESIFVIIICKHIFKKEINIRHFSNFNQSDFILRFINRNKLLMRRRIIFKFDRLYTTAKRIPLLFLQENANYFGILQLHLSLSSSNGWPSDILPRLHRFYTWTSFTWCQIFSRKDINIKYFT